MTIRPVLVPIPAPGVSGSAGGTGGLSDVPAARWRSPERVIQQRAYARIALRECAERCGAPPGDWEKGPDEVPLPRDGYYWSVSHKRMWAAAVISDRPVGIDIEHIVPRREGAYDALASEGEWTLMGDRSWHSFFRMWTAKEATLKANGVGIAYFLACRLVEIPDDRHMKLQYPVGSGPDAPIAWSIEHYVHEDHITAVTCGSSPVSWCVLDP